MPQLLVEELSSVWVALLLVCLQPVLLSQLSVVHGLPSSQNAATFTAVPAQALAAHRSLVVQASPSLQGRVLGVNLQPTAGSQLSDVHRLLSLQVCALPAQVPLAHLSPAVQALPSSHVAVLGVDEQPVAALQLSVVHELPSLQPVTGSSGVPLHEPPEQVSAVVQALPSVQPSALLV